MNSPASVTNQTQGSLGPAAISTTFALGTSQTLSPDAGVLSVIFTALEARVSERDPEAGTARSVHLFVPVRAAAGSTLTFHLRGAITRSEKAAAHCFAIAGDKHATSQTSDGQFELITTVIVPKDFSEVAYSIFIGAARGIGKEGEALVTIESLDVKIE